MNRLKPGATLGTCKIVAFIAEGGMATVYKAEQTLMGRTVAVKVLKDELISNRNALAGFLKEGMAGARLTHPGVAQVFYTACDNGLYYIVMEFVEGSDLKSWGRSRGPLSATKALDVARQVAEILSFSHERGIVHRDIKPGNIMIRPTGEVVLTDFGIASLLGDDATDDDRRAIGTLAYMSPEQYRGERVDGRSDLYSLGATLFALLCGYPPFRGPAAGIGKQLQSKTPPSLRDVLPETPRALSQLVARLLEKEPDDRYQTARDVVTVIDEVQAGSDATRTSGRLPAITLDRDRPLWPWALGATAAVVLGVCIWAALLLSGPGAYDAPVSAAESSLSPDEVAELAASGTESLERGMAEFSRALELGRLKSLLQLFEPDDRGSARLLNSLLSLLHQRESIGAESRSTHSVISTQDDVAHSLVLLQRGTAGATLRVHLTWQRNEVGRWHVVPDAGSEDLRFIFRDS